MKKAMNMNEYIPQKEDILLFDTNILIDLFYPINIEKDTTAITHLYKKILKAESRIIMSSIQLSEFINRCIRFQFDLYKKDNEECKDFKRDYRGCDDYKSCMDAIIYIIDNQWKDIVEYVDDKLSELNLQKIFKNNIAYDFNDAIIAQIANKYDAIFVTNDGDFMNYEFNKTILSTNQFLLNMSK